MGITSVVFFQYLVFGGLPFSKLCGKKSVLRHLFRYNEVTLIFTSKGGLSK
jgi:hypothetical protein